MEQYPYDQSTRKLLDELLEFLNEAPGDIVPKAKIHSKFRRKQSEKGLSGFRDGCLKVLVSKNFIEFNTANGWYRITPEGGTFINNGGFAQDWQNYQDEKSRKKQQEIREEKLAKLQTEELEARLSGMEQQIAFWQTSVQRNKVHIRIMFITILISLLMLAIAIFNIEFITS